MPNKCLRVVGLLCWASISSAAEERRVLLIPPNPIEQKMSDEMRDRISALDQAGVFRTFDSWEQRDELPAWVFEKNKCEIAYIFERPMRSDDYRYAVIAGKRDRVIVVRAGGIGGTYDIFSKKLKFTRTVGSPPAPQAPSGP